MNLLEQFALVGTQITRLQAEVKRNAPSGSQIHAQVEIKLNPVKPGPESAAGGVYQVTLGFKCVGRLDAEAEDTQLFTLECALTAAYRQMAGDPVGFDQFAAAHTSVGRQIYPLVRQIVTPLLGQLGFPNVQLPQDLFQGPAGKSENTAAGEAPSVH